MGTRRTSNASTAEPAGIQTLAQKQADILRLEVAREQANSLQPRLGPRQILQCPCPNTWIP